MIHAPTQRVAVRELREGRAVWYAGYEIPAPPEDQRTHRAARAWLLDHTGPLRQGRPLVADEPTQHVDTYLPPAQVAELDRRAEAQGVSRAAVVRDLLTEALASSVGRAGSDHP